MKKLNLGFRSATKNTMHRLQLNYVKTELEAEPLKKSMEQIAALGIFSDKTGEMVFATPVSASYVDAEEKVVFAEKQVAIK